MVTRRALNVKCFLPCVPKPSANPSSFTDAEVSVEKASSSAVSVSVVLRNTAILLFKTLHKDSRKPARENWPIHSTRADIQKMPMGVRIKYLTAMRTLVDLCLRVIVAEPQQCLQRNDDDEGEASFSSQALRGWEASTIRCAPAVDAATKDSWKDPWVLVRRACTGAAKLCEARPQVALALGSCGRLVDGSLPGDYWEDLRCDALSLAGSRAGPSIARDLAHAQARQQLKALSTLVALDLGGCLLIDDDSVAEVVRACQTLERLGLRDCRKLTDATVETAARLPRLLDLDVGGDFNITLRGVRLGLLLQPNAKQPPSQKRKRPPELALRALGLSGLCADDAILDALRSTPELRRLGLGYGKFAAAKFASAVSNWGKLIDLRVQWTLSFDVSSKFRRASSHVVCLSSRTQRSRCLARRA